MACAERFISNYRFFPGHLVFSISQLSLGGFFITHSKITSLEYRIGDGDHVLHRIINPNDIERFLYHSSFLSLRVGNNSKFKAGTKFSTSRLVHLFSLDHSESGTNCCCLPTTWVFQAHWYFQIWNGRTDLRRGTAELELDLRYCPQNFSHNRLTRLAHLSR